MYRRYVFALALFLLFGCDASRRDAPPVAAAPLVTIPTNAPASEPEPAQTPTPHVTSTPDATATTGPTVERPVQTMPMLRTGNVRANAGTDYDILHQLEEGTLVRLQKTRIAPDGSRWFFVSSGFLGKLGRRQPRREPHHLVGELVQCVVTDRAHQQLEAARVLDTAVLIIGFMVPSRALDRRCVGLWHTRPVG